MAKKSGGNTLLWSAVGTAVAAGAVYGGAYTVSEDYRNNPHTNGEYESLRGTANGLVITSAALGAVAAGLGVGAVVSTSW